MISKFRIVTVALLATASAAFAAGKETRTGQYDIRMPQRSPNSAAGKIAQRIGWNLEAARRQGMETDYDLASESFLVKVPDGYTLRQPYGLFVWVSPGEPPLVRPDWWPVLAKRKLIFVGAHNSGNERSVIARIGLALDAAHNMPSLYNIDPRRIYIAGLSGGGRISSITANSFPDVFAGGYYIIGCDFFRSVAVPGEANRFWRASFSPPTGALLTRTRSQLRHVLLTGETDMNRPQTKANFEAMKREGFRNVFYFEVPKMGHEPPTARWFEKGLEALEAPTGAQTRPSK